MEEGKLFLSVTVLYCHDYLNFFSRRSFFRLSDLNKTLFGFLQRLRERHFLNFLDCWWSSLVSLCNSNRWLAVISSNLTHTDVIVISSEDSGKTFVYVFFLFDSQECPSGRVSLGDRQLYLLHAFTPISGSGLKPTILFEYHCSKTK